MNVCGSCLLKLVLSLHDNFSEKIHKPIKGHLNLYRKVAPKRKEGRGAARVLGDEGLRKSVSDTAINQKVPTMNENEQ